MPLPQTTPKLVKRVRGPVGHAVGPHVGPIPSSPPIAEPYGTEGEPRGDTEGEGRRGNKMKWIRINLSCDGCSPEELDALEECASPRRLLTLSSPGGEEEAFPAGIPTDWWTAAADRMNLGLSRSEPDLLRYVSSSMTWVEDRLQRGDQVFLMLCPLSTAWLAAWMIRQSYRKDAARARMTNPEVQGALEWASDVTQWHNDPEDGPMCNLNASMVHQLEMLRAGVSAAHSAASSVVALPRLNFAAQFEDPVRLGQKAATTRLLDGPDNLTGVSHPGALCVAEVGTRGFGILGIRRVLDMYYSDVDDALAKIENMKTGHELKTVLRFFYPNVRDGDIVRVIFFSFLSPLP